ncbi:unnamed protein product [Effrenium voratum]|nr:unnamed protein product [Effrenium voratum]
MRMVLPFILTSFARVRYIEPELFDTSLTWLEEVLEQVSYENIAVLSFAVSTAGLHRPSLWRSISRQLAVAPKRWSAKALGRVLGSFRRLLMQEAADQVEDGSLLELFQLAAAEILKRREEMGFEEATELLMGFSILVQPLDQDALSRSCAVVAKAAAAEEMAPAYLAHCFYTLTALYLAGQPVEKCQQTVAADLSLKVAVCMACDLELLAQALLALSRRTNQAALASLSFRILLQTAQRETVRKAKDLGAFRAARLGAFLAAAAWPWRQAMLQPWFLPELQAFCFSDAAFGTASGYGLWLSSVTKTELAPPWPDAVAWYDAPPSSRTILASAYGGPEWLMGWERLCADSSARVVRAEEKKRKRSTSRLVDGAKLPAGMKVLYTTDGRDPFLAGQRYIGAFSIASPRVQLRAVAVQANKRSQAVEATFLVCHCALPDEIVFGVLRAQLFPASMELMLKYTAETVDLPVERLQATISEAGEGTGRWIQVDLHDLKPRHQLRFDLAYATVKNASARFRLRELCLA